MGETEGGLAELRRRYPWPDKIPEVPEDRHGWFGVANRKATSEALSGKSRVVLELGAWLGTSASLLCQYAPNATVISIDHWRGSSEHQRVPSWKAKLPTLYETFLVNCWALRDRLIPMKTTTLEGMAEIADLGIQPDLVYIDAAHEAEPVFADVSTAHDLFRGARIIGDDWTLTSVRQGVIRAAHGQQLITHGNTCWELLIQGRQWPSHRK